MDLTDLQILPPSSWEKFESLCLDIFREQWGAPFAQKNGRQGQAQHGVDIWGNPRHAPSEIHAVQCKGKDILYGHPVTKAELEIEVKKALTFTPEIHCWTLVTTAAKDGVIEATAREITVRNQSTGLFNVKVLGWEDLRNLIADSDELMNKHYPDQAPRLKEMLGKLSSIEMAVVSSSVSLSSAVEETRAAQVSMQAQLSTLIEASRASQTFAVDPFEAVLMARIDDARGLIQDQHPSTALRKLEQLSTESWDRASDFARFRLLGNRAAALFNLGRNDEAALICKEAQTFAPDDSRAIVYGSQGHFLLGDVERARSMLDDLLLREPGNDDAMAMRIAVAFDEEAVEDPYWKTGDPTSAGWNVTLSAARWYRHRGMYKEGLAAFSKALEGQPDRLDVMAEVASYTLEHLFRDKRAFFAHQLDTLQMQDLAKAVALLEGVWERVKRSEMRDTYMWSALNLCSALRYLGRLQDARKLVVEAVTLGANSSALLQQKALLEAATGDNAELLQTLDAIGSLEPEAIIMRADALEALQRPAEALEQLETLPNSSSARLRLAAAGSRVRMLLSLQRSDDALLVANNALSMFPGDPLARLVLSDFHRRSSQLADALQEAQHAAEDCKSYLSQDGLEKLIIAESLAKLDDWEGAADLLSDAGDPQHDSEPLRLRVHVLLNAGRRRELRDLLGKMSPELIGSPPYARAAAWLFSLSGDYLAARIHLDTYVLQVPGDLSTRMLWLDVVTKIGDQPAIKSFLGGDLAFLTKESRTRDLMALAQALARHGLSHRGIDLGYRVLKERWHEAAAHRGYLGLMLMSEGVKGAISSPTRIAPGVAFTVEDEAGIRRTFVIETTSDLKPEFNEIGADSRLAKVALGRTVGDTLRVNDNDLVPEQRIVELADKHLSLFHRHLRDFNTLFPDDNSIIGMNVSATDPGRLIAQLKPVLAARSAAGQNMLDSYKEGHLPIAFAGQCIGLDPIESWQALQLGKTTVDVCLGIATERDQAMTLLRDRPQLILDPVTFWLAGLLDLLDPLRQTFGPLGLAATTIELLAFRERDALEKVTRGGGALFEQDGNIGFVEPTAAQKRIPAEFASRILAAARTNGMIVPAIPSIDMRPEARILGEAAHPSISDTILAASGSHRVLLCEDRRLRQLSWAMGVTNSVWLQPAMAACRFAGHLSHIQYDDVLIDLTLWRHSLMSLEGSTLLRATRRWGRDPTGNFNQVMESLASPSLEPQSVRRVCLDFLKRLWREPKSRTTKESLTAVLLSACHRSRSDTPAILMALFELDIVRLKAAGGFNDIRQFGHASRFMKQWCLANRVSWSLKPGGMMQ